MWIPCKHFTVWAAYGLYGSMTTSELRMQDSQLHNVLTVETELMDKVNTAMTKDIADCGLSMRSMHALMGRGVRTLGDLAHHSRYEVMHFRNIGEKCVKEIEDLLKHHGLGFAGAR